MKKLLLVLNSQSSQACEDLEGYGITTNPLRLLCTSVEMTAVGLVRVVLAPKTQQQTQESLAASPPQASVIWIRPEWICWALEDPDVHHGIGFRPD